MTEKPLVSVIINCYNSEKYLRETIDSLLAQTYDNWEAIFWDNCSTDTTAEIIKSYDNPRFRYFLAEKNTPLGEARNLAMEKVCGVYTSFLDSDDVLESSFLQECVKAFEESPNIGLVYTRFKSFDENKSWYETKLDKDRKVTLSDLCVFYDIGISAAMFRYDVKVKNDICFDESFSLIEDYDFFINLAAVSEVRYIESPLMNYREHGDNLSFKSDKWIEEKKLYIEKAKKDKKLIPYIKYFIIDIENRTTYEKLVKKDGALKYIIKNAPHNPRLLRYLLALIIGVDSFYKLKRRLNRV